MQPHDRSRRERVEREAAEWVVRWATGDGDDPPGLAAWLERGPDHEVAFARQRLAWERTERLRALRPADGAIDPDLLAAADWDASGRLVAPRRPAPRIWRAAAGFALCIGAAAAAFLWIGEDSKAYATAIGEHRTVVLNDGSRLELNTDTHVTVHISRLRRRVKLVKGEALFEVRPDQRAFTVEAQDDEVNASRGAFAVRVEDGATRVLAVSGEVEVSGRAGPGAAAFTTRLPPGERGVYGDAGVQLRMTAAGEAGRILSWRQGAISLAGETLRDAAAEFNRYNTKQLVVGDDAIGSLRLGGYFRQNDLSGFARALQSGFNIEAREEDGVIYLRRRPTPQGRRASAG